MIGYLLELAIIHSILTAGYWTFLRKEQQYARMRLYMILSALIALVVPALNLSRILAVFQPNVQTQPELFSIMLSPVNFSGIDQQTGTSTPFDFALWGYGIISFFFLCQFIYSVFRLVRLERQSTYKKIADIYVRMIDNLPATFTFFRWIFVDKNIENEQEDYLPIIRHEEAHARLGHSYDLVLMEALKISAWWLPSTWYAQQEIKKIHEYQADAYALKSYSIERYSSILISSTLKSHGLSLASSFHDGLILKRIKAMKQTAKQINPWKLSVLGILTAVLAITFACNEELDKDLKEISQNAYQAVDMPESSKKILEELKQNNPGVEFKYVQVIIEKDDPEIIREQINSMDVDHRFIEAIDVNKEEGTIGIFLAEGQSLDYAAEKTKQEGDIFTIVEQQPEYPGGMEVFYGDLMKNLEYPAAAREGGIEGRVYVQFIVEKDGSLSEFEALKSPDAALSQAAIAALNKMEKFKPGMQRGQAVRVRMVLPVIFTLPQNETEINESFNDSEKIEQTRKELQKMYPEASIKFKPTGANEGLVGHYLIEEKADEAMQEEVVVVGKQ